MTITGSCHCGKTVFRMDTVTPAQLTRCTCSFCAKRGALMAYCEPGQFRLTVLPIDDAATVGKQDRSRTISASIAAAPHSATARPSSPTGSGTATPAASASTPASWTTSMRRSPRSSSSTASTFGSSVRQANEPTGFASSPRLRGASVPIVCPGSSAGTKRPSRTTWTFSGSTTRRRGSWTRTQQRRLHGHH